MLCLAEKLAGFSNLKSEISNLKSLAENVSRQLRGWAAQLQDSPIEGQRHLSDKSKRVYDTRRDRDTFLSELRNARESNLKKQA